MIGRRRIALAALLTTAAVIVPCLAWYVAGSRAATREADSLRDRPMEVGSELAASLAARLAGRLGAIREAEAQRPHYHYQSSYHDPQSTCHCASQTPSPLSAGLRDPLIEAHFQIDPYHDITLPTLHGDDWPTQVTRQWFDAQTALVAHIQDAASVCQAAVDAEGAVAAPSPGLASPEALGFEIDPADPVLEVGDLVWSTVPLGDTPRLAALRRVATSRGDVVQGFLVSEPEIIGWLGPSDYPVSFHPRCDAPQPGRVERVVDLPGPEWCIELDVGAATEDAEIRAAAIVGDFRRTFALGSVAAVLAGLTVVLLLWQTDRLARQRSRFAASAAHELRTPLASLRLYGEMIADDLGDPAKSREYAQRIAEESERLGRVVSNVLGFTRLERQTLDLELESGDVGEAVREALDRLEPAIGAAGARLRLAADGPAPGRFEREALFRILQNLVDNAEKYSRGTTDRIIDVAVRGGPETVRVEVADRGPGIAEGLRHRLFQPFTRGDAPEAPAGLGLGLSLVRELAAAQGGSVEVSDRDGGGAVFRLSLPAAV